MVYQTRCEGRATESCCIDHQRGRTSGHTHVPVIDGYAIDINEEIRQISAGLLQDKLCFKLGYRGEEGKDYLGANRGDGCKRLS